jgi:hypothetical protein
MASHPALSKGFDGKGLADGSRPRDLATPTLPANGDDAGA